MSTAEVASTPQDRQPRRRPFTNFVRRLANLKGNPEQQERGGGKRSATSGMTFKPRKNNQNGYGKSSVYPESGHLQVRQPSSQPSLVGTSRSQYADTTSYSSSRCATQDGEGPSRSNRSGAPTLATNPETVHSEAGVSKAATSTTAGGAISTDGAGAGSTFSSPNQSEHSLATTLTTLQSTAPGNLLQTGQGTSSQHFSNYHNQQSQPVGSQFSHQYPTLSIQTPPTASAIPRHVTTDSHATNSLNASHVLTDNASILTLASSSKRRRRSMDTDASVRALAPSSVFGSRESLPISVLSGPMGSVNEGRPSVGNAGLASAERASVYSSSGLTRDRDRERDRDSAGVTFPNVAGERNSLYAKQAGDAKSLRSLNFVRDDARSQYDAKSINNADSRSVHDVASLRSVAPSDVARHTRNDSIPGSVGQSPLTSPSLLRHSSLGATGLSTGRRSTSWREGENDKEGGEEMVKKGGEPNGANGPGVSAAVMFER